MLDRLKAAGRIFAFSAPMLVSLSVASPVAASQATICMPLVGLVSGLSFATAVNAANAALLSSNSGGTAPANDCSGVAVLGQWWLDTSLNPDGLKFLDSGSNWEVIGFPDGTAGVWTPPVGGGTASLTAAATLNLGSKPQFYIAVTGTTGPVTSFGSSGTLGAAKLVRFGTSGLVLSHSSALLMPNAGANITTQAGDYAIAVPVGGSNWVVPFYMRADGTALSSTAALGAAIAFTGEIRPTLSANTNNWNPTNLSTSSVICMSSSIDIAITGIVAQPTGTHLFVQNCGSTTITLSHQSASSTAANRFNLGGDFILGPHAAIVLKYDGTSLRWTPEASFATQASVAQAQAGTDTATSMTPATTAAAIAAQIPALASQPQAEAGANNTAWLSPLRGAQAIAALQRTIASQAEAEAGAINTKDMTPLRVAQAIAALGGSANVDYQAFTASGTWTKPSGTTGDSVVLGQCWGGGGGGSTGTSGGGGGGYKEHWFLASALSTSEAVAVGAGGTTATTGTVGGNSTFDLITAYGGGGGGNGGGGGGGVTGVGSAGGTGIGNIGGDGGPPILGAGSGTGGLGTPGAGQAGGGGSGAGTGARGGYGSFWGGGGGSTDTGGASIWGGGGGGATTGGTSVNGGNGGGPSTAGSAPAGGGGSSAAGARGECRVTTFK